MLIFLDEWSMICSRHREDTLSFLTVKTAAVRCGAKPGELLRVPLCERAKGTACAALRTVFARLGLPYRILSEDSGSVLALFFHPLRLSEALRSEEVRALLSGLGYPMGAGTEAALAELAARWRRWGAAHEVGVFLGYPAQDVAGFMASAPSVSAPGDRWRVFGDAARSRRLMRRYRRIELLAAGVCARVGEVSERFRRISAFSRKTLRKGA